MDYLFQICRSGNTEKLIDLYNKNPNIIVKCQEAFELACFHGKREVLHKLYEWGYPKYIDIHANDDRLFFDALFGPIEILEDIYNWRTINHTYEIEKNIDPILSICQSCRVDVIDRLLNWGLIHNLNRYDNLIFKTISGYNCCDMLTKIYDYSIEKGCPIDLSYDTYFVFRNACYYGQLENAKKIYYWALHINKPIDIHCLFEQPFRNACACGNIEIMKQLYNWAIETHTRINIRILNEDAFITACKLGKLNIIQQLRYWEPEIDIHHNSSECFIEACKNGSTNIVTQLYEWMLEDDSIYKLSNALNRAIHIAAENGHMRILELLFSWFPNIIDYFNDDDIIRNFKRYVQIFINNYMKCFKREWIKQSKYLTDECSICLKENIDVILTPCSHKYCKECIVKWLLKSNKCPVCRQII
jgi:hypothetical protein